MAMPTAMSDANALHGDLPCSLPISGAEGAPGKSGRGTSQALFRCFEQRGATAAPYPAPKMSDVNRDKGGETGLGIQLRGTACSFRDQERLVDELDRRSSPRPPRRRPASRSLSVRLPPRTPRDARLHEIRPPRERHFASASSSGRRSGPVLTKSSRRGPRSPGSRRCSDSRRSCRTGADRTRLRFSRFDMTPSTRSSRSPPSSDSIRVRVRSSTFRLLSMRWIR